MKTLFLVRHGRPVDKEIDPKKPLSEDGKREVEKIAGFLRKSEVRPDVIYHSGKTRAMQTAGIFYEILKCDSAPVEKAGISPLDDPRTIADEIASAAFNIMIVGHLPHLSRLTSLLVTGNDSESIIDFRQSGAVCLQRDDEGKKYLFSWAIFPEML